MQKQARSSVLLYLLLFSLVTFVTLGAEIVTMFDVKWPFYSFVASFGLAQADVLTIATAVLLYSPL
jgi:hypothetical protein